MTNPDRAEFGLQLTSVPENHRKNSHIPSWARASVLAARTFLAVLTATPGTIIATDAITRIQNPYVVYADSDIIFFLDPRLEPPGLDTKIDVVTGQQISIKASGKAKYGLESYSGSGCNGYPETDPDGNRYLLLHKCNPLINGSAAVPGGYTGELFARISSTPWFSIGSRYMGETRSGGRLFLLYNDVYYPDNTGGYEITINITPPPIPKPLPTATKENLTSPTSVPLPTNTPIPTKISIPTATKEIPPSPTSKPLLTNTPRPINTPIPQGGVQLCEHINYSGVCETFTEDDPDLRNNAIGNNQASSIRVPAGVTVALYQDINYGDACETFTRDNPDLRFTVNNVDLRNSNNAIGNDTASSIRVDSTCSVAPTQTKISPTTNTPFPRPTPTHEPTRVSTPTQLITLDALDIQIANARATGTVLAGQLEKEKELAQLQEQIRKTKEGEKTPTPAAPTPTRLAISPMKTPTRSSAEATATADSIRVTAMNTEMAKIMATATAEAIQSITPTPRPAVPEIKPTQVVPIGQPITPTGIPDWLWGLGAASLAGLAAYWGYRRGKLKNSPPPPSGIGGVGGPSNPNTSPSTGPTQQNTPGATSRGPNPNTGPATAPSTGPAQPKNPEWRIGQQEFKRRWQDVKSKLPPLRSGDTGNEQGYILDRFKAGMNVVHEFSLEDAANVPEMDTRLRAGIEYLTAEIWPDNRIFKRFFDPHFNAGLLTPEELAKIIYIPESYRHLSIFTKAQRTDVMRIHRTLLHALHPDLLKPDSDPKLKDDMDLLLKQLNAVWPLINKLIS